ncbi:hypothetical protein GX50_04893 [[Emmonsia] crescens]|uniref:Protein kinase domain-containing protein n=1 Tax=[Emmonsia] crescens TaxID=73230 RepID=A0A2B7ZGJ9_9EURO|nr:hypothetical protein GX50_04893 [Emmonsia crescens]
MEEQGEDEKKAFLHMIQMMLQYLPSDRATIQDVVESEWMQKWAFPANSYVEMDELQHPARKLRRKRPRTDYGNPVYEA